MPGERATDSDRGRHARVGRGNRRTAPQSAERIGRSGVDLVVAVGDYAKLVAGRFEAASDGRIPAHAYATLASARRRVLSLLRPATRFWVKASRAIGLDRLVETIREQSTRSVNGKSAVRQKTPRRRSRKVRSPACFITCATFCSVCGAFPGSPFGMPCSAVHRHFPLVSLRVALRSRAIRWLVRRKIGDIAEFDHKALNELTKDKKNTPTWAAR